MNRSTQAAIPLTLLLVCHDPPELEREGRAMLFGAQDKDGALQAGIPGPDRAIRFTLPALARLQGADGGAELGGPFVHGRPGARFVYLSYRPAHERAWARRWKVLLDGITAEQAVAAQAPGRCLETHVSAASGSTARLLGRWAVSELAATPAEAGERAP